MEILRYKKEEFKLKEFINYYNDNVKELLPEYTTKISRISLIDKDYLDVLTCDDEYSNLNDFSDYEELLFNGDYAFQFVVGKTYEGCEKIEIIDGQIYGLNYYEDDIYNDNSIIKDIGEFNLNIDNLIGLFFDFEEEENDIVIHLVDFEHGGELTHPRIKKVDNGGDIQKIITQLVDRFAN